MKLKPLSPLIFLSQFNQLILILMGVGFGTFFNVLFSDAFRFPVLNSSLPLSQTILPYVLLVMPWVFSVVFFLPPYMIFQNLTRLLKRYQAEQFINLSTSSEVKRLKVLFIIMFVYNLVFNSFFEISQSSTSDSPANMPEKVAALMEVFMQTMTYLSYTRWITISLDHSMPLIYILLLYVAVNVNQEKIRMRTELDSVV